MPKKSPRKPSKKDRFLASFLIHASIAGCAAIILLAFAFIKQDTFATLSGEATETPLLTEITIEHVDDLTIDFTLSRRDGSGYLLLEGDDNAAMYITLPASWNIKEVRGVPYDDVTSEEPVMGYKRYLLPKSAGVMMRVPEMPDMVAFASPSLHPTLIRINAVDLGTSRVFKNVVLMQHDAFVELWNEEE